MEQRPSTSKARGICRYYLTPRGCFARDRCKFLHGDPEVEKGPSARLTPYDQSKTCRFFANGYCKHGDKCWFLHVVPPLEITNDRDTEIKDPADENCSICFEKPELYGLLAGCSHVFCIGCLKEWRDPKAKSVDVVASGVHKKCPMCRAPSKFITPSSLFLKQEDPRKEQLVSAYKDSMGRVPCRHFVLSKAKDKNKPFCPFGKDCFYAHLNDDGTPYTFSEGVEASMRRAATRIRDRDLHVADALFSDFLFSASDSRTRNPFDIFGRGLSDPNLGNLSTALASFFHSLPRSGPGESPNDASESRDDTEPPPLPLLVSDPSRPITSWSLDASPTTGGLNVVSGNEWPAASSNNPASSQATTSSAPWRLNLTADDSDSDSSMPLLQSVESSDESNEDAWTSESEYESDNEVEPTSSGQHPAFANGREVPPPPGSLAGRLPRMIVDPVSGYLTVVDIPRTPSVLVPGIDDDMPSSELIGAPARPGLWLDYPPSPPAAETLDADTNEDLAPLEPIIPDAGSTPRESEEEEEEEQEQEQEERPPPFVTDGRGRVIGASGDSSTASFFTRMFDVLF